MHKLTTALLLLLLLATLRPSQLTKAPQIRLLDVHVVVARQPWRTSLKPTPRQTLVGRVSHACQRLAISLVSKATRNSGQKGVVRYLLIYRFRTPLPRISVRVNYILVGSGFAALGHHDFGHSWHPTSYHDRFPKSSQETACLIQRQLIRMSSESTSGLDIGKQSTLLCRLRSLLLLALEPLFFLVQFHHNKQPFGEILVLFHVR